VYGSQCDIVGTGGDGHSTFNISTTSSILASSLLLIAKHGNRASTSKSGSADVLALLSTPSHPVLPIVSPSNLAQIYERTNYAFLFAPNFHKGMKHIAPVRKEMPNPTIFNLLGPLTNPVEQALEARMIGVKKGDLVPVFAEALKLNGARKALVVCGEEDLDEISIAGPTHCARLREVPHGPRREDGHRDVSIEYFTLRPEDFGVPAHPLSEVSPGMTPEENAVILEKLLTNQLPVDDPILHFCLINTAALFVVAGVCDEDEEETFKEIGPGGGRWKEGVRLARQAISSGKAMEMIRGFAEVTNELAV
jgi:anthranilate phosphoribosyltransferase